MEDTSFVSFVSSCLLEPEREALVANKMNEDEEFSHLHDEGFLDCKFFLLFLFFFSKVCGFCCSSQVCLDWIELE